MITRTSGAIILADGRWAQRDGGIARYAREILRRLPEVATFTEGPPPWHPLDALYTSWVLARHRPKTYFSPGYNVPAVAGGSVIVTLHDLIHLHCEGKRKSFKRLYYDLVLLPALRRSRCVVTVSEFSRQQILEWTKLPPERVAVVPNACGPRFGPSDVDRHAPGYPYFLVVGVQKPHKNIRRILEAFGRARLGPDIRLLFSGKALESTRVLVDELRLSGRVIFAGGIGEDDLPRYYRGAVALVAPSLYEGFGLPILEAMACGTPAIGSLSTSIPEIAGGAALLVDPLQVEAIAEAMERMATDSNLRNSLRQAGFQNAARFSWDRSAARLRSILQQ